MDALDIALDTLGKLLGIEELAFTDDECQIEIGDTLVDLTAERSRQRLILSSFAGEMADPQDAALLARLLDANCHPAMGGTAAGVPAGSGAVLVMEQLDAQGLDTRGMETAIEGFLAAVDHVQALLAAEAQPNAAEPAADGEVMFRL